MSQDTTLCASWARSPRQLVHARAKTRHVHGKMCCAVKHLSGGQLGCKTVDDLDELLVPGLCRQQSLRATPRPELTKQLSPTECGPSAPVRVRHLQRWHPNTRTQS